MWNVATGSGNRSSGLLEDVIAKADGNHHASSNVRRYNSQPSDITLTDTTSGDIDSSVMRQDVRHAFRLFRRTPIVTATALLTIALGVGSSTAIFSVVYGVLLRPLPYPHPDRLVELFEDNPTAGMPR